MAQSITKLPATSEPPLRMPYAVFLDWAKEHRHAEWVDGEVIEFLTVSWRHTDIVVFLIRLLGAFVRHRKLGRVFGDPYAMLMLDERSHRQPDVGVILAAHERRITQRHLVGPADLAIEVLSEESATYDRTIKRAEHAEAGVPEYWIVDGREGKYGVELHVRNTTGQYERRHPDADGRLRSSVLAGFWLDPAWLTGNSLPDVDDVLDQIVPGIHEERAERVRQRRTTQRTS